MTIRNSIRALSSPFPRLLLPAALLLITPLWAATSSTAPTEFFENEVRPLLAKHCFQCHGPEKQKSGLRLDTAQAMADGGGLGPAVEPGNPESTLLQAIRQDGELKMPPETKLSDAEIDTLTRWVVGGAQWPEYEPPVRDKDQTLREARKAHWAYQPLAQAAPPATEDTWAKSDVDRFIHRAMDAKGLQPSPRADRRTLIRRLTYDLTGLPPTPEAVDAFTTDESPDAFEALVERLLATPQYGERWARHWLDAVRYADSVDVRFDATVDMLDVWRYRDWVVDALNTDMPYDQFVRYQIAGDITPLPDGAYNRDGLIATGLLAMGNWPTGDADKQKMVSDIIDDQVDVVTRTFLSMTMACARCHDHKFDPISTEEYYGLAGIFFSSSILPGPGIKTGASPMTHFPLAPPEELAKREAAQQRLDEQQKARETLIAEARADFARTQLARTGNYLLAAYQEGTPDAPAPDPALDPAVLAKWKAQIDGGVSPAMLNVAENYQGQADLVARSDADGLPSAVGNSADEARKYLSITQPERSVTVHPGPDEGVGIGWRAPVAATITIGGTIDDADATCGNGIVWSVLYREQGVERVLATSDLDNGGSAPINIVIPFPVLPGGQVLLNILPRDQHACDTTRVDLTITADDGQVWDFAPEVLSQFTTGNPWPDDKGNADVWWLYRGTAQTNLDAVLFAPWWTALREVRDGRRDIQALHEAAAAIQGAIDTALATEASPLAPALAKLSEAKAPYWIESPPAPEDSPLANVTTEIAALQAELSAPLDYAIGIEEGGVPTTEHEGLHDVRVHRRGEYTNLGDLVPRHMPALITGTEVRPVTQGSGRAELAQWLTDDSAPLLARVMVNRVWQHHFGEGLVRTPGDFGAQGQPPTHPELLDYLAARFIDSGWSIKALHRLILNTATWQQQSGADETRHNADPENRLLARMNRTRLDAESLRDSFFAVTDQLDTTPGGPAFADIATPRRTLYLKTVRSNLNTYTQLFDGADPTSIVAARNESTVAPQALFLMNDPLTLSTAEALAELAATDPTASAVDIMYRRLFNRPPTDAEHNIATETLQHLGHPENTNALAAYAQVLLSSNEFYFVD